MSTLMSKTESPRSLMTSQQSPSLPVFQPASTQIPEPQNAPQAELASPISSSVPSDRAQWGNHASRIAHDLRNVLMAVQGHVEVAELKVLQSSSVETNLHHIRSASERGQELLWQLIKGMPHQTSLGQEVNLCALVNETLDLFQVTLPSSITIEKIDHLTIGKIMGHSTQLFRMFSNLLTNAVQAMRGQTEGKLTILLDKVLEADRVPFYNRTNSTYLKLIVKDTGRGMSPDLCRRIFAPYFTTHQDEKGTGLGLAIVKEVVTDHHGVVTVASHPKNGTTFTVYFPEWQEA